MEYPGSLRNNSYQQCVCDPEIRNGRSLVLVLWMSIVSYKPDTLHCVLYKYQNNIKFFQTVTEG